MLLISLTPKIQNESSCRLIFISPWTYLYKKSLELFKTMCNCTVTWIIPFSKLFILWSYFFTELVHFFSMWALEWQLNGENTELLVHILKNNKLINLHVNACVYGWTPLACVVHRMWFLFNSFWPYLATFLKICPNGYLKKTLKGTVYQI